MSLWAPVRTKLKFSPANQSYVNLILGQPKNIEWTKGNVFCPRRVKYMKKI